MVGAIGAAYDVYEYFFLPKILELYRFTAIGTEFTLSYQAVLDKPSQKTQLLFSHGHQIPLATTRYHRLSDHCQTMALCIRRFLLL